MIPKEVKELIRMVYDFKYVITKRTLCIIAESTPAQRFENWDWEYFNNGNIILYHDIAETNLSRVLNSATAHDKVFFFIKDTQDYLIIDSAEIIDDGIPPIRDFRSFDGDCDEFDRVISYMDKVIGIGIYAQVHEDNIDYYKMLNKSNVYKIKETV